MRPRALAGACFALSGLLDLGGGLWAALDWRGAASFAARTVPDWHAQRDALSIAFADDALRQLWINLGAALAALGVLQLVGAAWLAQGRPAGYALGRLAGWCLLGAAALLVVFGGQGSSLVTEGLRGLVLLALVTWARAVDPGAAPPVGR